MAYFYRRPSGVYYARIRVPNCLRAVFNAHDLRQSLNTHDYAQASRLALGIALGWKTEFERLMLDPKKLVIGSPLLQMPGPMRLFDAAALVGLTVPRLFGELVSRRADMTIRAIGWLGTDVPHDELTLDDPTSPDAVIDVGETLAGRSGRAIFGELLTRHEALALVDGETFNDCVFYQDAGRRQAVVVDLPGVTVGLGELLALRTDVEAIRNALAAHVTPAMLEPEPVVTIAPVAPIDAVALRELMREDRMGAAYGHRDTPVSVLLHAYCAEKGPGWAASSAEQSKRMGATFIEVMGDMALSTIDRNTIKAYCSKLQKIPMNLHRVKKKHPGLDLDGLIKVAELERLEMISRVRADTYVAKIGEAFVWGKANGYMTDNPAANMAAPPDKQAESKREKRDDFDAVTLGRIFGQPWFLEGKGQPTQAGLYHSFQPCYYWIPLLALYTGARLDEIAQARIKDVTQTDAGQWYLNVSQVDEGEGRKKLKTANATRIIALHSNLIALGLPDYIKALRDAGHVRLFPELTWDATKGYGKYVGRWFNQQVLGVGLGLVRNNTQTFHSFRHTFITACDRAGMPDRVRNELAGHSRGEGEGHATYIKDRSADEQAPYIEKLDFGLTKVAPFDVTEGLKALRDALSRKH